jgi:endonuclease-8
MPEGDSIHRAAARLAPLVGQELRRFEARKLAGRSPRLGETIDSVDANGKHLLIAFSGGLTLDTHLGMTGAWRLRRVGTPPSRPEHLLRVRVGVDEWDAECFQAPTVRTFATNAERNPVEHLGPDLAGADADLDGCVQRWAALAPTDAVVADVLLDQRIANGVGNVYVSESCWRAFVAPDSAASAIGESQRLELLRAAHRLLRANLGSGRRRTVPGGYAVYERRGRPCRRCGTPVVSSRVGRWSRTAYWCPTCQPTLGDQPSGQ